MATETVTVEYGHYSADVRGQTQYQGTRTGGSGQRNIEDYTVVIAGHELAGTWDNDGRHNTVVRLPKGHPLAAALKLIAAMQDTLATVREFRGAPPIGWTRSDWSAECASAQSAYRRAKQAVEDDPLCRAILGQDADAE